MTKIVIIGGVAGGASAAARRVVYQKPQKLLCLNERICFLCELWFALSHQRRD